MVEPALDPGAIRFAIIVTLMVLSAGLASLPPARDFRVFLGAAIMAGAWVAAIALSKFYDNWAITSSFFVLDFLYIAGFYWLSRPQENDLPDAVKERNWAGYVAAALAILTVVELSHALYTNDFALRPLAVVLLGAIGFILLWGFARGFGFRTAAVFALILLAINLMAVNFFILTANILTLTAFFIIIWRGGRGAVRNIVSWSRAILNRPPPPPKKKEQAQRLK